MPCGRLGITLLGTHTLTIHSNDDRLVIEPAARIILEAKQKPSAQRLNAARSCDVFKGGLAEHQTLVMVVIG